MAPYLDRSPLSNPHISQGQGHMWHGKTVQGGSGCFAAQPCSSRPEGPKLGASNGIESGHAHLCEHGRLQRAALGAEAVEAAPGREERPNAGSCSHTLPAPACLQDQLNKERLSVVNKAGKAYVTGIHWICRQPLG